jgi:hypothetical protein
MFKVLKMPNYCILATVGLFTEDLFIPGCVSIEANHMALLAKG